MTREMTGIHSFTTEEEKSLKDIPDTLSGKVPRMLDLLKE